MADARQMSLVGFMQAGSTTVYSGSWRHPATEHGFLDQSYYQKLGRTLEEGCFDMMFFDDRLAMPGIYGGLGGRGGAARRPPGQARPEHRARPDRRRDPLDRARRDLLDDLLLAVPRGPDLRHPRPPLRRPGGVERGHLGQRQRGPELRRPDPPRPRRALRPGRRVPRGDHRAVGHLGGRRPRPRPGGRASSPTPTRSTSSATTASSSTCGARSPCPAPRRAARCCSRPARPGGAASSRPAGPS